MKHLTDDQICNLLLAFCGTSCILAIIANFVMG